jgi:putative ABC transport system ATP-binding protein
MSLRLRGCSVTFQQPDGSDLQVLRGVDLEVPRGESLAVLGRSGSGKTTLLNLLGLLMQVDEGEYSVDGLDVRQLSERQLADLRGREFGFVFQDYMLMPRRSAIANVSLPLLGGSSSEWAQRQALAERALATVGLHGRSKAYPNRLSGGQQQRVAVARALVRNPSFIMADEPTGALDPDTGQGIIELLLDLVQRGGRTLVLVTHDRELAAQCDRFVTIKDGVIIAPDAPSLGSSAGTGT